VTAFVHESDQFEKKPAALEEERGVGIGGKRDTSFPVLIV